MELLYTFTICHKDFGYITHSIILAKSIEHATEIANQKFKTVRSVMKTN